MSQQPYLRPVEPPASEPGWPGRKPQRRRSRRSLPTDRIKPDKQFKILGAIGRLSGPGKRPVTGRELSSEVGDLVPATVVLSCKFYGDAGWIENRRGEYRATDALLEYGRRRSQAGPGPVPEDALEALREPVRESWFWQALHPYFTNGKLSYNDAVLHLMREAEASEDHRPKIDNLLMWLVQIGLIDVQNDQVILAEHKTADTPADRDEPELPADQAASPPPVPAAAGSEGEKPTDQPGGGIPHYVISFDVRMTQDDLNRLDAAEMKEFLRAFGTVVALSKKT